MTPATGVLCCREGCPHPAAPGVERCAEHEQRRRYGTDYARKRREAHLAEQWRTAGRCPKQIGSGQCGGPIRTEIGRLGETIFICEHCDRQRRGVCRDCSSPVEGTIGKALRCARHKAEAVREQLRAYTERNHADVLARARASYANPAIRTKRNDYKRLWRKANPEKVRAQKKRYVERHTGDRSSWYEKYHARYRKKHRLHYRELQNTKNAIARAGWKPPPCRKCGKKTGWTPVPGRKTGRPWSLCNRCVFPCERKMRRRVRREAAKRLAADPRFGVPPKPVKVVRPRGLAVRGPGFERLCVTPGCDTVVTHRKKKCTKCRERDRQLAEQRLAPHRGRGRRTDIDAGARVA